MLFNLGVGTSNIEIQDVADFLRDKGATELRLCANETPRLRRGDRLDPLELPPLDWRAIQEFLGYLLTEEQLTEFRATRTGSWSLPPKYYRWNQLHINASPEHGVTFHIETKP